MILLRKLLTLLLLCSSLPLFAANERIALVIGNSNYSQVGSLENPSADAKNINNSLLQMGYKTKLVIDASESTIRKEVRKFAADSEGASIAIVFYAGHGAQINGENYLLPVDIEIPKRESDVQLSSLKVDDIINSLKSKTKIVFLDACRDNPVLIKNLSSGRGSFRGGLAAAKNSSLDESSGGVFIAYATDAGNIAADGQGQTNSPFTTALLQYIKQPVSIDDMFSMVVKEVRAKTNNKQKPYKYASLDGVVCLPGYCGNSEKGALATPVQPPMKAELQQQTETKIETPEAPIKPSSSIPNTWVLFNNTIQPKQLVYIDIGSIKKVGNRTTVAIKFEQSADFYVPFLNDKSSFKVFSYAIDCEKYKAVSYQVEEFDKSGNRVNDALFGIPEAIALTEDFSSKSTVGYAFITLACDPVKYTPILTVPEFKSGKWKKYYTIKEGVNAEYLEGSNSNEKSPTITLRMVFAPIQLAKLKERLFYPSGYEDYFNTPTTSSYVTRVRFNCLDRTTTTLMANYYDNNGMPVMYASYQGNSPISKTVPGSAFDQIHTLICK